MAENIKVRWLTDHEQIKIAPKTISTQILNEDGTLFKDTVENAITNVETEIATHASNGDIHVTAEEKEAWNNIEIPSLDGYATKEYVEALYKNLGSTTALAFYCIEEVTIVTNGISKVYPANSNVDITFAEDDVFEIIPASDNSILSLTAFPGALGTYYPWLEGVKQFSNILFDMNDEEMYSKWSQGNQGSYQVQFAQYTNCIFWSDNPYISDVARRTNYTLCSTSQLPLCYSTIPDNTFKSFYLAFGVNSDPNWSNPLYKESFAKATWATQAFSYYGARMVGFPGHDSSNFTITLPKDCRGLMFDARNIECAGTFDAANVTNFGAKSGSWREAFGDCPSLRRLYIKNLKVNLNISWSPVDYDSIYYIISEAANTNAITISVSPYTYNLLSQADFDLATSKNITIALITTNYVEDRRLSAISDKADKSYVDNKIADLVNSAPETLDTLGELADALNENKDVVGVLNESIANKQNKNVIVSRDSDTGKATMTAPEIMEKVRAGENVYFTLNLSGGTLHPYLEGADTGVFFYSNYIDNNRVVGTGILIGADGSISNESYQLAHLNDDTIHITADEREKLNNINNALFKTEQTLTDDELTQVRKNLKFIGKDVEGQQFTIDGTTYTASPNAEIFGDYASNIAIGQWSIAEGSGTVAKGRASHAEGAMTQALADGTHTEGYQTKATGYWSHAEGEMTVVTSYASHAEGSYCTMPDGSKRYTTAGGYASHSEGGGCHTTGSCAHAEGLGSLASGNQSHVEGRYTIAAGSAQHVEGVANIEDTNNQYIHIAGNGTLPTDRSNAYTLDWNGNGEYAGDVIANGHASGTTPISLIDIGSRTIALETAMSEIEDITTQDIQALFSANN